MTLNTLWFILIGVLFTGFFILEGFDYGVGILLPFLAKKDEERRVDDQHHRARAGTATRCGCSPPAARCSRRFPNWYATLFSGFYLALFLMLLALIVRGVAFEFRSKDENPKWRGLWDWCFFVGSAVPALLWGVAMANIVRGVPIDANMNYVGGFFNLLNPYALLGGLAGLGVFTLHGAVFLSLRTDGRHPGSGPKRSRRSCGPWSWSSAAVTVVASYFATDIFQRLGVNPGISAIGAGVAFLAGGWFISADAALAGPSR